MNEHASCPNCGHTISVEKTGDLELLRCTNCSWERGATVYQGPPPSASELYVATLRWKDGHVSSKEAMAAKRLIREFQDTSITTLLENFGASSAYELGTFHRFQALQLQTAGEQNGLVVTLQLATT